MGCSSLHISCRSRLHNPRDFLWLRPRMAQEENTHKCRNSISGGGGGGGCGGDDDNGGGVNGSGSRSSKKLKQKKVPQRGLGVAQLEKIRLEEQHKKEAANTILSKNSILSPTNNNSSCFGVQCANFRPSPSPSTIPLPPPSLTGLSSPNSVFRPPLPIPNSDGLHPNCVAFSKPLNGNGVEIGWSGVSGPGNGKWPKLWSSEYNCEGENQRLDHRGFGLLPSMNLPYESFPPPHMMHRPQPIQQPSFSPKVNVSQGNSSASAMNFHMEPPSNQSYHSNCYPSMWPDEEKKVGIKRPYPYSLENPPGPSMHCRFPPIQGPPITISDESASCSNGGTINIEPINPISGEDAPCSAAMDEPNLHIVAKENGKLSGDFLTLALPSTTLPHHSPKCKPPSAYVTPHRRDTSDLNGLPYQKNTEEPIREKGPCRLIERHPFYSFIPVAKAQNGQAASTVRNCNGEGGGGVDLNLKL